MKALFDTNILIDYLNAIPQARDEFGLYDGRAISIITWMEVLIGAAPEVAAATRGFLSTFEILAIDTEIAEKAVSLRREHRIKLPDAIIWASATVYSMLLVTRNTKDFPSSMPGIRLPYVL